MDIKTNYKEVINEEKQGKELYFDTIPTKEEREELKQNGYKWNNAKKCWYIKLNKIIEENKIELGVKPMATAYPFSKGTAWEGVNARKELSIKEIASIVKKESEDVSL